MENQEASALERLLQGTDDEVRRFFLLLRPADLADFLETVPEDDRMRVVRLMSAPLRSEVLHAVQEGDRQEIFEDLSPEERAEIVHESRSDDAADLIGELPPGEKEETLATRCLESSGLSWISRGLGATSLAECEERNTLIPTSG